MQKESIRKADDFIKNEKQYHLGFLPIEKSNPKTAFLDREFAESTAKGVQRLLEVDQDLVKLARQELTGDRFALLANAMYQAMKTGHKIVFSGCGATGRLSILLESIYRKFFLQNPEQSNSQSSPADKVFSIMTGGDYALIRSVEFFEDYQQFGRKQVRDLNVTTDDVLVAITGTGETSSILGTVMEAAEREAQVFLIICVAREIPEKNLERCRQAFSHQNVTVIDMPCGAMAISGSTRMQSTTLEMLIAGVALETALARYCGKEIEQPIAYAEEFAELLTTLGNEQNLRTIADYIEFEEEIYTNKGFVTYFADEFLLDVLTDTTERSPTFSLPPFRKITETGLSQSCAFVKNPCFGTHDAWLHCLARKMRCLEWTHDDYISLNAGSLIGNGLPMISGSELTKFEIGFEKAQRREENEESVAVLVGFSDTLPVAEFTKATCGYNRKTMLLIGNDRVADGFIIRWQAPVSPLNLMQHLAVKLLLNIISTGTMVRMGRVTGNWMTYLDVSNKKLLDRGIRIIADQCGLDYRNAAIELFTSIEEVKLSPSKNESQSPVQYTIKKLKGNTR